MRLTLFPFLIYVITKLKRKSKICIISVGLRIVVIFWMASICASIWSCFACPTCVPKEYEGHWVANEVLWMYQKILSQTGIHQIHLFLSDIQFLHDCHVIQILTCTPLY